MDSSVAKSFGRFRGALVFRSTKVSNRRGAFIVPGVKRSYKGGSSMKLMSFASAPELRKRLEVKWTEISCDHMVLPIR